MRAFLVRADDNHRMSSRGDFTRSWTGAHRVHEQHDIAGRFDAIYLSGGNPLLFRRRLEDGDLGDQVRAFAATGRPVIAASGGAMQLTPNVSLYRL